MQNALLILGSYMKSLIYFSCGDLDCSKVIEPLTILKYANERVLEYWLRKKPNLSQSLQLRLYKDR